MVLEINFIVRLLDRYSRVVYNTFNIDRYYININIVKKKNFSASLMEVESTLNIPASIPIQCWLTLRYEKCSGCLLPGR